MNEDIKLVCPGCSDPHSDGRCCRCGEPEHAERVYSIGRDYRSRTAQYKPAPPRASRK